MIPGQAVFVERRAAGHVLGVKGDEVAVILAGMVEPVLVPKSSVLLLYRYVRQPGQPGRYVQAVSRELSAELRAAVEHLEAEERN